MSFIKSLGKLLHNYREASLIIILFLISLLHLNYAVRTDLYFSVDDFVVLSYFKDHNFFDILTFALKGDVFGYKKFVGYTNLYLLFKLFKTNPLPYILANHIIHTFNLFLLFIITKKLTKNIIVSSISALILNSFYLFWFSNIHEYSVTLFSLLTVYTFLTFGRKYWIYTFLFIFSLYSKEVGIVIALFLTFLSFVYKYGYKKLIPIYIISLIYIFTNAAFYINGKLLNQTESYVISFNIYDLLKGLLVYFNFWTIGFLLLLPLISKKYNNYLLFIIIIISLLPGIILVNHHQTYYMYLPSFLIGIYFAINLPKNNLKIIFLTAIFIMIFKGRSFFPIIAKRDYPNWQKHSIDQVLNRVNSSFDRNKNEQVIYIGDINLERDAKMMLGTNTLDLFLCEDITKGRSFVYENNNIILRDY